VNRALVWVATALAHSLVRLLLLMATAIGSGAGATGDVNPTRPSAAESTATIAEKIQNGRLLGVGVVLAYGVAKWDYFSRSPHTADEGWFQADTEAGGADKLGHFYASHLLTDLFSTQYQQWGYDQRKAGRSGAMSSFLLMGMMEAGDSFSDYGYSSEDMLMNLLGSFIGYQRFVSDDWHRRVDFRVEHNLDGGNNDPFTDYQRIKFLMAIKLDGFDSLRGTGLEWLELNLGYFSRGYGNDEVIDTRTIYLGVGFNLARLFERSGWHRTAAALHYVQVPKTSITVEHKLPD